MSHQAIIKNIKEGQYDPIYFLHGEEPYFIDKVIEVAEQILPESEKAFNEVIIYGKGTDFKQVVDQCSQYPMMSPRRVVILKEAQSMDSFDKLLKYVERPNPMTSLFIGYKKRIDGRKKIFSTLKKQSRVLQSDKIRDYQVAQWISGYVKSHKRLIHPDNAQRLADLLGTNLSKVINEIDKLMVTTPEGGEISFDQIIENVGLSKDFNVFELQNALTRKDISKAFLIGQYFGANPKENPIPLVLANLYGYFSKVYIAKKNANLDNRGLAAKLKMGSQTFAAQYKTAAMNYSQPQIKTCFEALLDADKAFKGVGRRSAKPPEIIQELLIKIFYGKASSIEI